MATIAIHVMRCNSCLYVKVKWRGWLVRRSQADVAVDVAAPRLGRDATCRRWVLAAVFRLGFPRQARRVNVQPRCLDASGASGTRPVMMKSTSGQAEVYLSARHASIASVCLWATPVRRGCGARPITATRLHHHHQRAPPSPFYGDVVASRRLLLP